MQTVILTLAILLVVIGGCALVQLIVERIRGTFRSNEATPLLIATWLMTWLLAPAFYFGDREVRALGFAGAILVWLIGHRAFRRRHAAKQ